MLTPDDKNLYDEMKNAMEARQMHVREKFLKQS